MHAIAIHLTQNVRCTLEFCQTTSCCIECAESTVFADRRWVFWPGCCSHAPAST